MYKELSASQITKDALLILKGRNVEAWRQVNTAVRSRRGVVKLGVPDILGYNKGTGIMVMVEVKKIGDKLSCHQIKMLSEATKCIRMIATQGDGYFTQLVDFEEYLNK